MPQIMRLNTELARKEPEGVFESPLQMVGEIGLTRGQKIAALRRWELLVQARLAATNEGMPAPGPSSADTKILDEITEAIQQLEENSEA